MIAVKPFLLVGAMLMMADLAFAQSWTQTSAPSGNWEAVASSADGSKLIAGSQQFIYCISTNSGSTWTTNNEPQIGSAYGSWTSIASSVDGTKFVGINFTAIWVSTNLGLTWLSNNVPGVSFFASVALSADGTKLAVVDGKQNTPGLIYISTNSGVTVTPTTAPINNWLSVASSADGTKLVAAATTGTQGLIYASTNSGLTWTLTSAPTNNNWVTVASSADGSKLVAASGAAFVPDHIYGGVYTSTNFGMTWTSNNVPNAQWQIVASSTDGSKLVAAAVEPMGWIYTSTNSGETWISNSAPNNLWLSVASSADGGKLLAAPLGDQSFSPGPIYVSQTIPSPHLNFALLSTNLALSWTIPSTNFMLQQSSNLVSWVDMTNPPVLNLTNLQNEVMLSPSNRSGFYRLKTP
jgi:hypothetical protein